MVRILGLAAFVAPLVLGTPLSFSGHGEISGANGFFDLIGSDFRWHVTTDSTSFMGTLCELGAACDLGLSFTADSRSDQTGVYGHWNGRDWGGSGQHYVITDSSTHASWSVPEDVTAGSRVSIPIAMTGTITGPGLQLEFAGAGSQWITVMSIDDGTAGLLFGSFDFSGAIDSGASPIPEPATLGLGLAAITALLGLRRAVRAVT